MSNYHTISLLCIISKVIEKIIFKAITQFVADSLTPHQFGFLSGRSSLQQLLLFVNELLDAKRDNMTSDVVYLNFKKPLTLFPTISCCSSKDHMEFVANYLTGSRLTLQANVNMFALTTNALTPFLFYLESHKGVSLYPCFLSFLLTTFLTFWIIRCHLFTQTTLNVYNIHSVWTLLILISFKNTWHVFQWSLNKNLQFNFTKFVHL